MALSEHTDAARVLLYSEASPASSYAPEGSPISSPPPCPTASAPRSQDMVGLFSTPENSNVQVAPLPLVPSSVQPRFNPANAGHT